jgi:hypothetical protein
MPTPEDLATLWSFIGGLRCVLTPVDGGWQIRIEDDRETIKAHVAKTSHDALAIAEQWLRDYPDGTRPAHLLQGNRHEEHASGTNVLE